MASLAATPGVVDAGMLQEFARDVYNAYTMVAGSPYMGSNPLYARFGDIRIGIDECDEINAYATITDDVPTVVVHGGLLFWLKATSMFAASLYIGTKPSTLRKMVLYQSEHASDVLSDPYVFIDGMAAKFGVPHDGYYTELCSRMFTMMLAALLAHECGHLCLGHHYCGSGAETGGTSRNDERSADIFACSVLQSLGTGEYGATGMLSLLVSLMFSSPEMPEYNGLDTHPAMIERIRNVFATFDSMLKYSRVSLDVVEKIIESRISQCK